MRISILFLSISLFSAAIVSCSTTKNAGKTQQENEVSGTTRNLIIYYDAALGKDGILKATENYGAKLLHDYNSLHGIAIEIPQGKSMDKAISHFKKIKGVVSVDRDQQMQIN